VHGVCFTFDRSGFWFLGLVFKMRVPGFSDEGLGFNFSSFGLAHGSTTLTHLPMTRNPGQTATHASRVHVGTQIRTV